MTSLHDQLIEYIETHRNTYAKWLAKKRPDLYALIEHQPGNRVAEKLYNYHNPGAYELAAKGCKMCAKPLEFVNGAYRKYCSNKCSQNDPDVDHTRGFRSEAGKQKRTEALIKRYGTASMLKVNAEKIKQNALEKHGVDHPLKRQDMQAIRENSLLAKHGVKNAFQLQVSKDSSKKTMLATYGVEHALQSPELLAKMKATMVQRHGAESPLESKTLLEKIKATNIERYGVENAMQSVTVQHVKATNIKQSGSIAELSGLKQREGSVERGEFQARIEKFKERYFVEPLFTVEQFISDPNISLKWKHICGVEYISGWGNGNLLVCPNPECKRQSIPQRQIYEHVKEIMGSNDGILVNDRKLIAPYELDIVVPDRKIAIEMDGVYHHQDDVLDLKQRLAREIGYNLLHITDLSWYDKKEIWKSIISSKLGRTKRIYARKCKLVALTSAQASKFTAINHLQGKLSSKIAFGLEHESKLVACMTFGKPRFNKSHEWELLRYASLLNHTVVGGASKLLKAFIDSYKPKSIISYAKVEHSIGKLYDTLGFSYASPGVPSYFYVKNSEVTSRYQAQKHKLKTLLGDRFDESLTETENMQACGYIKVNDRGSAVYVLEIDSLKRSA